MGHDTTRYPHGIRFVNVASGVDPTGVRVYFDLHVRNTTLYVTDTPSRNTLAWGIAQITFKANTRTGLRVQVRPSCATADSCSFCDDTAPEPDRCRADCLLRRWMRLLRCDVL